MMRTDAQSLALDACVRTNGCRCALSAVRAGWTRVAARLTLLLLVLAGRALGAGRSAASTDSPSTARQRRRRSSRAREARRATQTRARRTETAGATVRPAGASKRGARALRAVAAGIALHARSLTGSALELACRACAARGRTQRIGVRARPTRRCRQSTSSAVVPHRTWGTQACAAQARYARVGARLAEQRRARAKLAVRSNRTDFAMMHRIRRLVLSRFAQPARGSTTSTEAARWAVQRGCRACDTRGALRAADAVSLRLRADRRPIASSQARGWSCRARHAIRTSRAVDAARLTARALVLAGNAASARALARSRRERARAAPKRARRPSQAVVTSRAGITRRLARARLQFAGGTRRALALTITTSKRAWTARDSRHAACSASRAGGARGAVALARGSRGASVRSWLAQQRRAGASSAVRSSRTRNASRRAACVLI